MYRSRSRTDCTAESYKYRKKNHDDTSVMMMIETSSTFLLVGCHSFSLSIKFSSLLLLSSAPQDESDHSSSLVLVLI